MHLCLILTLLALFYHLVSEQTSRGKMGELLGDYYSTNQEGHCYFYGLRLDEGAEGIIQKKLLTFIDNGQWFPTNKFHLRANPESSPVQPRFDHYLTDVQYPAHVARFPPTKSLAMAGLSSIHPKGAIGTASPPPTGGGYSWGPSSPHMDPKKKPKKADADDADEEIDEMIADPSSSHPDALMLTGATPKSGPGAVAWTRKEETSSATRRQKAPGSTMTKQFLRTYDDIDEMIQPATGRKQKHNSPSPSPGQKDSQRGHIFYESGKPGSTTSKGRKDLTAAPTAAEVLGIKEEDLAGRGTMLALGPDDPEG
jgi:hypothetical protein